MKRKRIALQSPWFSMSLFCLAILTSDETTGQVTLYDNTGIRATGFDQFVHPREAWSFAQPFRTDEGHATITSVTVPIAKFGATSGEMRFSVWNDDDGVPGQMMGELGVIEDVGSLPSRTFGQALEMVTLDQMVTGLAPDSTYYVVLNLTDIDSFSIAQVGPICGPCYGVMNAFLRSTSGTNGAGSLLVADGSADNWIDLSSKLGHRRRLQMSVEATGIASALNAGDSDQDFDFDQLDLVQVQVAAKYLTGQTATWGEGDWDGAPGGSPGSPPAGDGLFNQLDVIAAQQAGTYLTGPYAAIQPNGERRDGQTSLVYHPGTGEVSVDAPAGIELTSISIDSAAGIFASEPAANLGGSFDNDADDNIFKATFGSSFASLSFGNVAQTGLSEEFVLGDLTVVGSLAGGGDLGNVDLVYVPEPTSVLLLSVGLAIGLVHFRRVNR